MSSLFVYFISFFPFSAIYQQIENLCYTENLNKIELQRVTQYMSLHRDHDNILENISLEEQWKNIMQSCLLKTILFKSPYTAPTHTGVVIFIVIIVLVAVSTYIEWKMMMT